jgi:hypothetical protein
LALRKAQQPDWSQAAGRWGVVVRIQDVLKTESSPPSAISEGKSLLNSQSNKAIDLASFDKAMDNRESFLNNHCTQVWRQMHE